MTQSRNRMGRLLATAMAAAVWLSGCAAGPAEQTTPSSAESEAQTMSENAGDKVVKTDAQWKATLTPEQYRILRQKGTERAFTGKYWNARTKGVYRCAGCGQRLFLSGTKFESGCGWPSFYAPADEKVVETQADRSLDRVRTEVLCSKCGGHLGHVFTDGPTDKTGLRYCINSTALELKEEAE
jgi:peptide-methionine (R)-S-oxide reductase